MIRAETPELDDLAVAIAEDIEERLKGLDESAVSYVIEKLILELEQGPLKLRH